MSILPFVILAVLALLPLAVLIIQIIIKLITKGADVALQDASDTTTTLQKPLQRRLIYGLSAFYVLLSIVVTSWAVGTLLNPSGSLASYIYFAAIVSLVCAGEGIWLAYLTKRFTGAWMQPISSTKTIIEWENKRADNALKIFGYYILGIFGLVICILLILVLAMLYLK
jgi:hypothetical protein